MHNELAKWGIISLVLALYEHGPFEYSVLQTSRKYFTNDRYLLQNVEASLWEVTRFYNGYKYI